MNPTKAWAKSALQFIPEREEEDVAPPTEAVALQRPHEQLGDTAPRVNVGVKTHPGRFGKGQGKAAKGSKGWARARGKKPAAT